ncbi:hypothetical protein HID58_040339 [Brassica napus]|uniref:Protein TSSC4 n=1 Tax=Brassica napus TaxID=3708 RepID=A0ABQ8B7S9_BRANA|nr:hypothetical protein HID58_040339 [Brassica napus]
MADEDFQSRVERIFRSLTFSRSTSSTTSTSYAAAAANAIGLGVVSLRRRSGEAGVEARAACFEGEEGGDKDFGDEDDDWSIRASMGLERTLDDEVTIVQVRKHLSKTREQLNSYVFISLVWKIDEEDEYDKVTLGKEDGGKGVSMEDAISRPCGVRIRDPRAYHAAAKLRLKEDELEANK